MNYNIIVIQSSWRARQSQRPSFYYPPLNLPKQVKYLARKCRADIKALVFGLIRTREKMKSAIEEAVADLPDNAKRPLKLNLMPPLIAKEKRSRFTT